MNITLQNADGIVALDLVEYNADYIHLSTAYSNIVPDYERYPHANNDRTVFGAVTPDTMIMKTALECYTQDDVVFYGKLSKARMNALLNMLKTLRKDRMAPEFLQAYYGKAFHPLWLAAMRECYRRVRAEYAAENLEWRRQFRCKLTVNGTAHYSFMEIVSRVSINEQWLFDGAACGVFTWITATSDVFKNMCELMGVEYDSIIDTTTH